MWNYLYMGLLLLGLTLLYFAIKLYNKSNALMTDGVKTTATVIQLLEVSGDDGSTYKPVFEFTDRNHNRQQFQSDVSSSPPVYKVGEKVKVVYNASDPEEVKVVGYWGLYRWTVVLLCLASPLIIIGGGYLLYVRG